MYNSSGILILMPEMLKGPVFKAWGGILLASFLSLASVTSTIVSASESLTPSELLGRVEANRNAKSPHRVHRGTLFKESRFTNSKRPGFKSLTEQEFLTSGEQNETRSWFSRVQDDGSITGKHGMMLFNLVDPPRYVQYDEATDGGVSNAFFSAETYLPDLAKDSSNIFSVDAVLFGDNLPVHELLRASSDLSLGDTMEEIDGFPCYVLEGSNEYGEYKIWIDPDHGYHWRKANVRKSGGNLFFGEPMNANPDQPDNPNMAYPMTMVEEFEFEISQVKIEEIEGHYFIVAAESRQRERHVTGEVVEIDRSLRASEIDSHPDFGAMGAFKPQLLDGTPVNHYDFTGLDFEWRNGEIALSIDNAMLAKIEILATDDMDPTSLTKQPEGVSEAQPSESKAPPTSTLPTALIGLISFAALLVTVIGVSWAMARKKEPLI